MGKSKLFGGKAIVATIYQPNDMGYGHGCIRHTTHCTTGVFSVAEIMQRWPGVPVIDISDCSMSAIMAVSDMCLADMAAHYLDNGGILKTTAAV